MELSRRDGPEWSFFKSDQGTIWDSPSFWNKGARASDLIFDLWLRRNRSLQKLIRGAEHAQKQRVLVVGVDVPSRSDELKRVFRELSASHHHTVCKAAPLIAGRGKFENVNAALAHSDLQNVDWLIVTDDDIAFGPHFLDTLLAVAQQEQLKICMPAHRFRSFQTYKLTQRHWRSLVRQTRYVECGPLTAFHRDAFELCLPFPELRYAWGTDIEWSQKAWDHDMRIGVVDACPVEHLRPVGGSYDLEAAKEEAANFLKSAGIHREKAELLQNVSIVRSFSV